jgi:uncharacterized protein (TIGR03437 family)
LGPCHKDRRLEGWTQALLVLLALVVSAVTLSAQPAPVIGSGGLVNAASFLPAEVSSGAIAQGSIFSLFGSDLSVETASANVFPLPRLLADTEVEVMAGGIVYTAPLLYVSPLQINGIFPSDVPIGLALVRVVRLGQPSNWEEIKVVRSYPGIYTVAPDHSVYSNQRQLAAAQRYVSGAPQQLQQTSPASPGNIITLWATGLFATPGFDDTPVGFSSRVSSPVRVFVGGEEAEILYQSPASCCVGLDQINVRVPIDSGLGCHVPVQLRGGSLPSNIAVIPIAEAGQVCPGFEPYPTRVYLDRRKRNDFTVDRARTFRGRESWDPNELPPVGSCEVYTHGGPGVLVNDGIEGELVEVEGPASTFQLSEGFGVLRYAPEGSAQLGAGFYHVTSNGGNFPAYEATLTVPSWRFPLDDLTAQIDPRSNGLRFTWDVGLSTWSSPTKWGGVISVHQKLNCTVDILSGSFTVPPEVLSLVEPSTDWSFGAIAYVPIETETDGPETGLVVYSDFTDQRIDIGPRRLPTSPITLPNTEIIRAELAMTSADHQRGLMNRSALSPDSGMLFFFSTPGRHSFWMSQTLIPLDIIWLDTDRKIVTISANTPPCPPETTCPFYSPTAPALYVLELAAGEANRRGLSVGDQLDW